jgi:hypothetical protein
MPTESFVAKSLEELRSWGQADSSGLADYTFELQAEVLRLRDRAAHLQFSDSPKNTQIHPLLECECGEDLSKEPAIGFQRRWVLFLTARLALQLNPS